MGRRRARPPARHVRVRHLGPRFARAVLRPRLLRHQAVLLHAAKRPLHLRFRDQVHPRASGLHARAQPRSARAVPVLPVQRPSRDVLQGHLQAGSRALHDRACRRVHHRAPLLASRVQLRCAAQPSGYRRGHRRSSARQRALPQRGRRRGRQLPVLGHRLQLHGGLPGQGKPRHQNVHRGIRLLQERRRQQRRGRRRHDARRDFVGSRARRRAAHRQHQQVHRRGRVLGKPASCAVAHGRAVRRPLRRGTVLRGPDRGNAGQGGAFRRRRRRVLRRLPHLPNAVLQRQAFLGPEGPAARRLRRHAQAGHPRRELP